MIVVLLPPASPPPPLSYNTGWLPDRYINPEKSPSMNMNF